MMNLKKVVKKFTCGVLCTAMLSCCAGDVKAKTLKAIDTSSVVGDVINSVQSVIVTAPENKVTNLYVSKASMDSVTLKWTKSIDASAYVIQYWISGTSDKTEIKINDVSEYTITNLEQNVYMFAVQAANIKADGSYTKGNPTETVFGAPLPLKPTGKINNAKEGYCSFFIEGLNAYSNPEMKSQIVIYDTENNQIGEQTFTGNYNGVSIECDELLNNNFYYAKICGYYTNSRKEELCGEWSDAIYFSTAISPLKTSQKNRQVTLQWPKVKGAAEYTVYVSKKKDSGFKKVCNTSKLTKTVSKYGTTKLQAGKNYYFKVVASKEKDGNTYTCSSSVRKVNIK